MFVGVQGPGGVSYFMTFRVGAVEYFRGVFNENYSYGFTFYSLIFFAVVSD